MSDSHLEEIGAFVRQKVDEVKSFSDENIEAAVISIRSEINETKSALDVVFGELSEKVSTDIDESESRRALANLKTHELIDHSIHEALIVADERICEVVEGSKKEIEEGLNSRLDKIGENTDAGVALIVESHEEALAQQKQSSVEQIQVLTEQLKEQQTFEAMLTKRLSEIKDGEPGEQGKPGLDRPLLEPIEIVSERDYPKNTLGTFNNGLWISTKNTIGCPENDPQAWHCVLDAMATMSIELEQDHSFKVSVRMATGSVIEDTFNIPYPEHVGVWEKGKSYDAGQWVTKGHSIWKAMEDTSHSPPGNGWKQILTAPKGKSVKGDKGDPGIQSTLR